MSHARPAARERPNILLILTDQQRFDTIHALGNGVIRTPHLDRICREGVAFTSAFSASPVCVSARCSLHYGQYPFRTRCYENRFAMPVDRPSFMDLLAQAGYRTHGIGKCHFTPDAQALRGFQSRETQEEIPAPDSDDYVRELARAGFGHAHEPHGVRSEMYYVPQVSQLPAQWHPTQWVGDRACRFITGQGAGANAPWMLFTSFIHPHPPFAPPVPWNKLYRGPLMPVPRMPPDHAALLVHINRVQNRYKYRDAGCDLNLIRQMRAHYYACISFIDHQVGRLLASLEATGQLDRTLIVFTTDHGDHLGDYGCFGKRSMHDTAARIPLLARLPQRFRGGLRCDAPASLVDVAPTLLGAAGVSCADGAFDGCDLSEVALGMAGRDIVFAQHEHAERGLYMAVTPAWKYVYSAADGREFLFDRAGDPQETRNLAGSAFGAAPLAALRQRLLARLREAGETAALDGDGWRAYPRLSLPSDPDALLLRQDPPGYDTRLPGYTDEPGPA